ncbi:MAG: murein biosynthesis integral membrane protein MurJ, partial [Candidatus Omnitrophica bacterium]|nr:murein biosynthesis integral membrane protein MurJ [Candidatus Omnitrophota bacterium]
GIIFSPLIVRLIAPGFSNLPETFNATVMLNRLIFPYIIFVSLTAYGMGVLNSLKHFSVPAFGPCLLNISIILCALAWGEGIAGLATGILIGGVLQMAIQLPVLYKKGFRLRLFRRFKHPAAKEIGMLLVPRLASSSIYQLNNFVDSIFGSFSAIVGQGGVAILYFAYRLIQFPLGIFSNAISQAILPAFSTQALEETRDNLKRTLSFGLRLVFFIMVPASIGFIIFSRPIVSSLFEGGRFDAYSSMETSRVLLFYSIGLCAYGGNKIVSSCFFALKDTITPTKVSAAALIMNIILNSILMFPMKLCGLALATSVSGITSFLLLFYLLVKKIGGFPVKEIRISFLKIMAAGAGMGFVCFFAGNARFLSGTGFAEKTAHLTILVGSGVISYALFCFLFRVGEMNSLITLLRNRRSA